MAIFRKFTEASGQGLGMADLEGHVIYANPTLCRFMGEERPDDPVGKHVRTYYAEEDLPMLETEILPAAFEKGQATVEIPLRSLKGEVTPTIQNVFLIRDDKGDPAYLANVITDITGRKRA
jgi:PAS domain S-box-containing protein